MKKVLGILVCMLMMTTLLPISAMAGDSEHPEISDAAGDGILSVDIQKAWFSENPLIPDYLYVTIQLAALEPFYRGTLLNDVFWTMNGDKYYVAACLGRYLAGVIHRLYVDVGLVHRNLGTEINGFLDITNYTITCIIPKLLIGNPHPGYVLKGTFAWSSQRTPFMEKLGWDAVMRSFFYQRFGLSKFSWIDQAPDSGCGLDYTILY